MPELVICNTSPLFYLHRLRHLEILQQLYHQLVVPEAVRDELHVGRAQGEDAPELEAYTWITMRTVRVPEVIQLITDLGPGEAQVLALALEEPGSLVEQYESALRAKGIACVRIQQQVSDDPGKPGLRTATMHRVKGLEFDAMIIAGVNYGMMPLTAAAADVDSDYANMEFELKERSLLYVATTRAKTHVLLTCHGMPSTFLV